MRIKVEKETIVKKFSGKPSQCQDDLRGEQVQEATVKIVRVLSGKKISK